MSEHAQVDRCPEPPAAAPGQEPLSRARIVVFGVVVLVLSAFWLSWHELSHGEPEPLTPAALSPDTPAPVLEP